MLVLGHRGSGWHTGKLTENTISSFEDSKKRGADGIETDIRITKDNVLVLFHNKSVGKRKQIAVNDLTHKELSRKVGYKVTTLNELIDWSDDNFLLNLEIKDPIAVPELIKTLRDNKTKQYIVSSFWHNYVAKVSKATDVPSAIIMSLRPILLEPFLQLLPVNADYIIWDKEYYTSEYAIKFSRFKHLLYNVGNEEVRGADGAISDNLNAHLITTVADN
jgi:glycerophosphoryl diester phosphodiesterase